MSISTSHPNRKHLTLNVPISTYIALKEIALAAWKKDPARWSDKPAVYIRQLIEEHIDGSHSEIQPEGLISSDDIRS